VTIKAFTAASYVAAQTRNVRVHRGLSQEQLAARLTELLVGPPPEIFQEDDWRRRKAEVRKQRRPKWTQTRVAKLERGSLQCVSVDDVLELALALDVSPLVLMTPMLDPQTQEERRRRWPLLEPEPGDVFRVRLAGALEASPEAVRQWIRGVGPILSRLAYPSDQHAETGERFYLFDSQPSEEWGLIREAAETADRVAEVRRSLRRLGKSDDVEAADAE
jgi:transcriptional regulator with XRE-family HTH domain